MKLTKLEKIGDEYARFCLEHEGVSTEKIIRVQGTGEYQSYYYARAIKEGVRDIAQIKTGNWRAWEGRMFKLVNEAIDSMEDQCA